MNLQSSRSLTFHVPFEDEESLTGYFLVNYDVLGFEESAGGALTIYLSDWQQADESALNQFLRSYPSIKLLAVEIHADKDWNAVWEAGIEPVKISGDLAITPSWKTEEAKKFQTAYLLIIDPKMSFGTGHHETTRLCLKLIEKIDCKGKKVLDIGTGTGALAMYALLRGADRATGIDIDEWSYNNAVENRSLNSFSEKEFELLRGDITNVNGSHVFGIILANIHRNILLQIHQEIKTHHVPDGDLILSGILEYDAEEIQTAYEAAGYRLKEKMQENEWVALLFGNNGENDDVTPTDRTSFGMTS